MAVSKPGTKVAPTSITNNKDQVSNQKGNKAVKSNDTSSKVIKAATDTTDSPAAKTNNKTAGENSTSPSASKDKGNVHTYDDSKPDLRKVVEAVQNGNSTAFVNGLRTQSPLADPTVTNAQKDTIKHITKTFGNDNTIFAVQKKGDNVSLAAGQNGGNHGQSLNIISNGGLFNTTKDFGQSGSFFSPQGITIYPNSTHNSYTAPNGTTTLLDPKSTSLGTNNVTSFFGFGWWNGPEKLGGLGPKK